ncbi:hypothetical protein [Sphingomicrobium aestuariivivum]|uniref:hypothetical protein n=1 Tax=Sphingomicrobium aestuariivivum TaxID=1582356 RepID=UPI001FD713D0|nr:hypothetical protein [Sphingomicrobium aestuariivivum]MCJ8191900.1 hypothetical protein [Sphingomicrobium aestuariivivum]
MSAALRALLCAGALAAGCAPAAAQEETPAPAASTAEEERDALIARLEARIERLERRLAAREAAAMPNAVASSRTPPPGQAIDPDAERALERTLVEAGTALVSPGAVELVPSLTYSRSSSERAALAVMDGTPVLASEQRRLAYHEARLRARVGLPANMQLDASVPWRLAARRDVLFANGTPLSDSDDTASGVGDVSVSLSHVLLGGERAIPTLIGRLSGTLGTAVRGEDHGLLGGGYHGLGVGLSASQRLDPLVFAGSLSWDKRFERDGVDPGGRWGFSLASYLAVSPEASLRLQYSQSHAGDVSVDGVPVPGSGGTSASLSFGTSVIAKRGLLVDVGVAVGLTERAPDLALTFATPIRVSR